MKKIVIAVLWIISIFMIYPIIWLVLSSLKKPVEIFSASFFPSCLSWNNYSKALSVGGFEYYFLNSFIVAIGSVVLVLIVSSLAGYALSRFKFPFRDAIFYIFIGSFMIPRHVLIIPLFLMAKKIGIYNTRVGLVLVYCAFWLPISLLILRAFFLTLPREIEDSAIIDGCSRFRVFINIMLPMIKPALSVVTVFTFVYSWNEFLFALIFVIDKVKKTIPIGLLSFVGEHEVDYPLLFAGLCVSIIPMIVLYYVFHNQITKGLTTAGSFK